MSASALGASSSAMTRNSLAVPRVPRVARTRSAVTVRAALPGARSGHFRAPKFERNLGEWSEGADVKALQQSLGTMRQDGVFGTETVAAVRLWQRANDISATGYFGPQSRAKWAKTNGGVRPSWASTAVVVSAPGVPTKVAGAWDFTGPALLGGFVLAAILKAQDDPLGFAGIFTKAISKFTVAWTKFTNMFAQVMFGDAHKILAKDAPMETPAEVSKTSVSKTPDAERDESWATYEQEADTRVYTWGTPGFKEQREKRRAALEVDFAKSMRGPSMQSDMNKFATLEFSDFVRAQETVDPEERQARRETLDQKFRERRGLDNIASGSEAMRILPHTTLHSQNNVVSQDVSLKKESPLDVSMPVLHKENATKTKPRPVPPGVIPASSPSAMAAYEKLVREMEAAEEAAAEKSGPR